MRPAPYSNLKQVSPPNDMDSRLAALVAGLQSSGLVNPLPDALAGPSIDWSRIRVGGHSQGGGQAGVIAKRRLIERACMFSSPTDTDTALGPASWIAPEWVTPLDRRRAVVHQEDQFFTKIQANLDAMGMVLDTHWRKLTAPTSQGHAYPIASTDPEAIAARAWCLE
jgi:hypothetical protein